MYKHFKIIFGTILLYSASLVAHNPEKAKTKSSINTGEDLKKIKYLFEVGGYFGVDVFNNHGKNESFVNFSGLQAQLKFNKIMLSADLLHFNRMVDDKQLIPSFFSNTYKISFGNMIGFSLGYCDNTWVSYFSANGTPAQPGNTFVRDTRGYNYQVPHGLLKYSAPSYILGYQFTVAEKMQASQFQLQNDDYDTDHQSKIKPLYFISGSIDILYAPKVTTDSTFIFSPYGYYNPYSLKIYTPLKEQHFGVQLKMIATTPYALGFYMSMGILPGITSTDKDTKLNLSARAGILFNLSYAK